MMKLKSKVMDIVAPKDKWEEGYARLEYARMGMNTVGDKRIRVVGADSDLIATLDEWLITPSYLKALKAMDELEAMAEEMGWNRG